MPGNEALQLSLAVAPHCASPMPGPQLRQKSRGQLQNVAAPLDSSGLTHERTKAARVRVGSTLTLIQAIAYSRCMNLTTVLFGVAMVAFGLVTVVLRQVKPSAFRKLGPMRERFGHAAGTLIHVIAYSLVPIGAGIWFVMRGFEGQAIF